MILRVAFSRGASARMPRFSDNYLVKLILASIGPRAGEGAGQPLFAEYLGRLAAYASAEHQTFRTESALLSSVQKHRARTAPWLVLLDSRGVGVTSTELAERISAQRSSGRQLGIFAIGPADGWSEAARTATRAAPQDALLLSLGPMTLPHELARVLLAEQLYRACTILAGHPYHCGH